MVLPAVGGAMGGAEAVGAGLRVIHKGAGGHGLPVVACVAAPPPPPPALSGTFGCQRYRLDESMGTKADHCSPLWSGLCAPGSAHA